MRYLLWTKKVIFKDYNIIVLSFMINKSFYTTILETI